MSFTVHPFWNTFAIALPYITASWEQGRLYDIELHWPIALWAIKWQIRFPTKRRTRNKP